MQKILHLNSYFIDNNLYNNIYSRLDSVYSQTILVPIKYNREDKIKISIQNGDVHCLRLIKKHHAFFYTQKINSIYQKAKQMGVYKGVDLIHAHNLFIDGAVALKLKKEFGVKYIVAIRMTDVDLQYRYMLHRRKIANEILRHASRIIFISSIYEEKLFSYMPTKLGLEFSQKSIVIPNGIDNFWLKNDSKLTLFEDGMTYKILYIGQIQKRKNIIKLIDAIESITKKKLFKIELNVVGKFHPSESKYVELFQSRLENCQSVNYLGHIFDKRKIQELLRESHLMALPSTHELFGLVYIEAISQNTPVLYCEGEGISPFLDNQLFATAIKRNPLNKTSIAESIQQSINKYSGLSEFSDFSKSFSWDKIVNRYMDIYKSL